MRRQRKCGQSNNLAWISTLTMEVYFDLYLNYLGNGKSSSGLLEFSSVPTAVEALILANHFTMHRDNSTGKLLA